VCDGRKALIIESIGDEVFPISTPMVAPPRTLGMLRDVYSSAVRMAIRAEFERISSSFLFLRSRSNCCLQIPQSPGDERADGILQPA
jgi:hypothetical protein